MSDERSMILRMLEQGKISSEEAERLLNSLGAGKTKGAANAQKNSSAKPAKDVGLDGLADDLGKKIDGLARDLEPKLQALFGSVIQKTSDAADKIFSAEHKNAAKPAPPSRSLLFEDIVAASNNELNISGLNGYVSVIGYNGDKITAKVLYEAKKSDPAIKFVRLGSKYFADYDEEDFRSVSIDVLIPDKMFSAVKLSATNGKLTVSGVSCGTLKAEGLNSDISISKTAAKNIYIEGSNGRIALANISSDNAVIENINGAVEALDLELSDMRLNTLSGGININMTDFKSYDNYTWNVESGNAGVKFNLPAPGSVGYDIKAHTTLSDVSVNMSGLDYTVNQKTDIKAKSFGFEHAGKKVTICAETSNAPLTIN